MNQNQIRQTFLDFFQSKNHQIVPSAPMVIKNDPTLMFTNAGMNQFKDVFLGHSLANFPRVADTQKCLRVSGKHNDLEEVGVDTYHHTMFEMLGNWSFGNYFKKEAIDWAWELLALIYKIPQENLYVTVFEGSKEDKLNFDQEAFNCWKKYLPENRIINGSKKDNFWEMGDTGPCGPCSEIHVDIRSAEEKLKIDGKLLVNQGHPQVIEIWNLVFMEFNRVADGSLKKLPAQHVDTGMGFERLCMVLQGKQSNYDTDVFQPLIKFIAQTSNKKYGEYESTTIAMRVMADHIRTIAFAIADGQLPSNNKAGYVIRRILRRAVRYAYTFLGFNEPFLYQLVAILVAEMGHTFPELKTEQHLIERVIKEEEASFLRTLGNGIEKLEQYISSLKGSIIEGVFAFELFDTYGFPIDLTQLMAKEKNLTVDMLNFNTCMEQQKTRSRADSTTNASDWIEIKNTNSLNFVGYETLCTKTNIIKYRKVKIKEQEQFQIVLDTTPFYAESGGQVGDTGTLTNETEQINILATKKENNLTIHLSDKLPSNITSEFTAQVNATQRHLIENNHSATHLLHAALREVLGTHVEQKGSLVNMEYLRFDFSHYEAINTVQKKEIETLVNNKIRANIQAEISNMPLELAKKTGAMALFGEKYGDTVRVVKFGQSVELCGGTHTSQTGNIGLLVISSETAIAAGVRRIEARTATHALQFIQEQYITPIENVKTLLKKNSKDIPPAIQLLLDENQQLKKQIAELHQQQASILKTELLNKINTTNGINFIIEKVELNSAEAIKNIVFELKNKVPNLFILLAFQIQEKAFISLLISENLAKEKTWNANTIIRELAQEIEGGGGGQAFYATAGGTNIAGINAVLTKAKQYSN